MPWSRKTQLIVLGTAIWVAIVVSVFFQYVIKPPIKIGVLHSESKSLCEIEIPMLAAIEFAVDEINASPQAKPLGRRLTIVKRDVDGQDKVAVKQAALELIEDDKVDVIFGCLTSSCRKYVKEVVEKKNHLLYYSMQYEGIESSENVVYVGAVPNQQVIPALEHALAQSEHKNIVLVGSDYVYSRVTNKIIKKKVEQWGGRVLFEAYRPLDSSDFADIVQEIAEAKPDAIFNAINGPSNHDFFRALRGSADDRLLDIPTYSFSIPENNLDWFSEIPVRNDYLVWGYLESLANPTNVAFKEAFQKHGYTNAIGAPMVNSYSAVYLWSQAVEREGDSAPDRVNSNVGNVSFMSPAGMLYVDERSRHTWKTIRIARITDEGQLEQVGSSSSPVKPEPFPSFSESDDEQYWADYLAGLRKKWGGNWGAESASAPPPADCRKS